MNIANINISNNFFNSLYTFFHFSLKKKAFFPIQDTFFCIFCSFFVNKATNNSIFMRFCLKKESAPATLCINQTRGRFMRIYDR